MPTIKQLRESKGWSQQELASRAGVAWTTINRIENAARQPSKATLRLVALALGINPENLIDEYRNKPAHE